MANTRKLPHYVLSRLVYKATKKIKKQRRQIRELYKENNNLIDRPQKTVKEIVYVQNPVNNVNCLIIIILTYVFMYIMQNATANEVLMIHMMYILFYYYWTV